MDQLSKEVTSINHREMVVLEMNETQPLSPEKLQQLSMCDDFSQECIDRFFNERLPQIGDIGHMGSSALFGLMCIGFIAQSSVQGRGLCRNENPGNCEKVAWIVFAVGLTSVISSIPLLFALTGLKQNSPPTPGDLAQFSSNNFIHSRNLKWAGNIIFGVSVFLFAVVSSVSIRTSYDQGHGGLCSNSTSVKENCEGAALQMFMLEAFMTLGALLKVIGWGVGRYK